MDTETNIGPLAIEDAIFEGYLLSSPSFSKSFEKIFVHQPAWEYKAIKVTLINLAGEKQIHYLLPEIIENEWQPTSTTFSFREGESFTFKNHTKLLFTPISEEQDLRYIKSYSRDANLSPGAAIEVPSAEEICEVRVERAEGYNG